ncbi:MAG: hypothetical protein GYA36_18800 [Veillonellaceae bacterium]|jgi:hypothetical protein|nr:hypothetical protein [Veillonellaceae bacterium]
MKKKLFLSGLAGVFLLLTVFSVNKTNLDSAERKSIEIMTKANADVNPDCPNGCKACGEYCHCYIDYYWLREGNTNQNQ